MGRFIGGRFGSIVSIAPNTDAPSGIYSMPDHIIQARWRLG